MNSMQSLMRPFLLWGITLLVGFSLTACGRGEAEPTPTPTKTPDTGAQTGAAPSATPQPPQPATAAPAQNDTPTPAVQTMAVVQVELLNVRGAPSADGEVVTQISQGERYTVIGRTQDNQWIQLVDNGRDLGWVAAEFVTLEQVAATPAQQPAAQAPDSQTSPGSGSYLPATMTSPDYGAQAFLWWRPEVADRDLRLMHEANFKWVKQAFAWETIEGAGKGVYDWTIADRVVEQVNNRELKLLARLSTDPELTNFWAGHPPGNGDDFAEFAFALASRYNCTPQAVGCIQAYQIWNEPNLAREWGFRRPNPAEYTEFLQKAYAAIKRGNPNALVISAGMAPTGDNNDNAMPDDLFYEGMYQAMGSSEGYFDMLGVHGAGFAAPPELDPAEAASNPRYGGFRFFAFRHVEDIRDIMVRYGDADKQIVLLEFGWTFDEVNASYRWHGADAGIDQMVQADYLRRAYIYAQENWQPWIGLMSLLTMPNLQWVEVGDPRFEEQYWWAIMEPSPVDQLHFRAAYIVLCVFFNELEGQACVHDPNR